MTLSKRSLLVRWAYLVRLLAGDPLPYQTSVCALFWRSVAYTPLAVVVWVGVLLPVVLVAAPIAGAGYGLYLTACMLGLGRVAQPVGDAIVDAFHVIGGFLWALKHRACPIVRFD